MHTPMRSCQRWMCGCLLAAALAGLSPATHAQDADKTKWHGNIALGMTLAKGNSETFQLNAAALAEKLLARDEFRLGASVTHAIANWGRTNESVSANAIQAFGDYKHLFSERWYGNLRADFLHDDVADIAYRVILSPAVGYYFIKNDTTRLSGEIGPGYVTEDQNGNKDDYLTLRVSQRGEHAFSKTAKVWEQVDYLPQVKDFSDYLLLAEVGAEAALNSRWSLRVVFQDKYDSVPADGKKANDLTLISALVWKY